MTLIAILIVVGAALLYLYLEIVDSLVKYRNKKELQKLFPENYAVKGRKTGRKQASRMRCSTL